MIKGKEESKPCCLMEDIKKYVFLDFDGVMVSTEDQNQRKANGCPLTDEYGRLFSPGAVENLRVLLDHPGIRLCLITSWVYAVKDLHDVWKDRNMPGKIYHVCQGGGADFSSFACMSDEDVENLSPGMMIGKGQDVRVYLSRVKKPYAYVILDDIKDFYDEQLPHYIQVDPNPGLTMLDVQKAIAILNNPGLTVA
ncbi:MAG: HAD domain-containing protein [Bacteroidales bacterium]|nr:HAD domain-containing protein [Bacteroidales bacterium]